MSSYICPICNEPDPPDPCPHWGMDEEASNKEHARLVKALKSPPEMSTYSLTPKTTDLLHALIGVCTEAGELFDSYKKWLFYSQPLDMENFKEELGDLEWYLELARQSLDFSREEIIRENIAKLKKRYPEGRFTSQDAKERKDKR